MQNLGLLLKLFMITVLGVFTVSCSTSSLSDYKCKSGVFRNNVCQDKYYYSGQQRTWDHQDINEDRFYLVRPRR